MNLNNYIILKTVADDEKYGLEIIQSVIGERGVEFTQHGLSGSCSRLIASGLLKKRRGLKNKALCFFKATEKGVEFVERFEEIFRGQDG